MGSTLDDTANAELAILAAYTNGGARGYIIEIAGYASTTGTKRLNQKLTKSAPLVSQRISARLGTYPCAGYLGPSSCAFLAGPPSPYQTATPVPAIVVTAPSDWFCAEAGPGVRRWLRSVMDANFNYRAVPGHLAGALSYWTVSLHCHVVAD